MGMKELVKREVVRWGTAQTHAAEGGRLQTMRGYANISVTVDTPRSRHLRTRRKHRLCRQTWQADPKP